MDQRERMAEVFRGVRLFAGLDGAQVDQLTARARMARLTAGSWLYRQGDSADDLAVVVAGRLDVVMDVDGHQTVVRHIGPGAALGELALLTSSRRSASVRAVRDSELVVLPRAPFQDLLAANGTFAAALAQSIARDLQDSGDHSAPESPPSVFSIVPLNEGATADEVAHGLQDALRRWGPCALLDDAAGDAAVTAGGTYGGLLDRCEGEHDYVVMVASDRLEESEWRSFCVRSADRVLAVCGGGPELTWVARGDHSLSGLDLAVGTSPRAAMVGRWMERLEPSSRHMFGLGESSAADFARMGRLLTGRGVGVVLSGGGARGLAHIGVLERLTEAGIEVDQVGGCSMGGFVAAMFALGWSSQRMQAVCRDELRRGLIANVKMPWAPVLKARRVGVMLNQVFGEARLEDLPIQAFTVSSDLVTGALVVDDRGSVAQAVRATMAVPGLLPPVERRGQLLVDGGVLDNLPVDVMAAAGRGPVIAVDVMRRPETSPQQVPGVIDTIVRSIVLGGWQRSESNRARADVLIAPQVDHIGFLDFDRMDEAVAAGRVAAERALPALLTVATRSP